MHFFFLLFFFLLFFLLYLLELEEAKILNYPIRAYIYIYNIHHTSAGEVGMGTHI